MAKSKKFKSMKFRSRFSGKPASSFKSKSSAGAKKSTSGPSSKRVVHKATKVEVNLRRNIRKGKLG